MNTDNITIMSSDAKINNPVGLYVAYDKVPDRSQDDFFKSLTNNDLSKIIHSNYWEGNKGGDQDKRYIICMSKEYNDSLTDDFKKENKLSVVRFIPSMHKLKEGTTHGFYVTSNVEFRDFSKNLIALFKTFEDKKFIQSDSFEITFPKAYPDGKLRNYSMVTFKKSNDNNFPKAYIRKLKALVDNSTFNDVKFSIDWLSIKVMKDIKKGQNKKQKENNAQKVEEITVSA